MLTLATSWMRDEEVDTTALPGMGLLPLTVEVMEHALHLPENYHIVAVSYDPVYRLINFVLTSSELPEVTECMTIPVLSLQAEVHYPCLEHQDYHTVTTSIHASDPMRKC